MADKIDILRRFQREWLLRQYGDDGHVLPENLEVSNAIDGLINEVARLGSLLHEHHQHHLQAGTIGLPDGDGGWVEIDNGAEYADSALCEKTTAALRDQSVPPGPSDPPGGMPPPARVA